MAVSCLLRNERTVRTSSSKRRSDRKPPLLRDRACNCEQSITTKCPLLEGLSQWTTDTHFKHTVPQYLYIMWVPLLVQKVASY